MRRSLLIIIFGALALGGVTLAQHSAHGKGGVKTLFQKDITEKIDGSIPISSTLMTQFFGSQAFTILY